MRTSQYLEVMSLVGATSTFDCTTCMPRAVREAIADRCGVARTLASTPCRYFRTAIETLSSAIAIGSWLTAWIGAHLARLPDAETGDPDFTFIYVVLGAFGGAAPNGEVDGTAVLEVG
jgi:hypothetical protein